MTAQAGGHRGRACPILAPGIWSTGGIHLAMKIFSCHGMATHSGAHGNYYAAPSTMGLARGTANGALAAAATAGERPSRELLELLAQPHAQARPANQPPPLD